jgi:predicted porin
MTRKLLALAVVGAFAAPAVALADGSSVVLTGVIHGDIGFGQEKTKDGDKVYKRQANIGTFATRWQIDGTEDLGWSKAIFSLAFDQQFAGPRRGSGGAITANNNQISDTAVSNRNSYLGLTGGWGTLKIGQNEHQYEIQQILQDPDPGSESQYGTLSLMTNYGLAGGPKGFTRRDPQSIWYTSPDFGGVTVDVAYITPAGGKTSSPNLSPQGYQLAVQWKAPFGLALYGAFAHYDDDPVALGGSADNKNDAVRFGVGYGMEMFQVDFSVEQLKFKTNGGDMTFGGQTGSDLKRLNYMLSGAANFGPNHIRAAINIANKAKLGGTIDNSEGRLFFLAYAYTLSKRTELSVIYGRVDNKDNAAFAVNSSGNDSDRLGFGVRHSF